MTPEQYRQMSPEQYRQMSESFGSMGISARQANEAMAQLLEALYWPMISDEGMRKLRDLSERGGVEPTPPSNPYSGRDVRVLELE